jgi:polyisoprenoid-binding protein YceI
VVTPTTRWASRVASAAGFVATITINRQAFSVSWNHAMDKGGIVVSNTVELTIDAEASVENA